LRRFRQKIRRSPQAITGTDERTVLPGEAAAKLATSDTSQVSRAHDERERENVASTKTRKQTAAV
jgi:hypothetical protein